MGVIWVKKIIYGGKTGMMDFDIGVRRGLVEI